jgi:hypothetical protein
MLRLGPPYYQFEGVTVMGDAHDDRQYYYFPNAPHVPIDDAGRPAIRFIMLKEAQDEVEGDEEDLAGFLFFDTVLSWSEGVLDKVKKGIEDSIKEDTDEDVEIRLGPLPFRKGGVQLSFLDETTRPVQLDPPEVDPNDPDAPLEPVDPSEPDMEAAWVPYLKTSGIPSLYGENRAVFTAQLNRKATKLMFGAFDGLIPASVYYELEFVGQMRAYDIRVTADWEQVYHFVQNRFTGNFIFFDFEIDDIVSELEEQKVIVIEAELDTSEEDLNPAKLEAQFDDVRKDLQELVLETFFEPATNPHEVTPDSQSGFDSAVDSLVRMNTLAHGFPSVGYSRKEVDISEMRTISVDYSVHRAVSRRIAPQAHIHVLFDDLNVTKDDIVTVVDGADDMWSTADFSASVVADFEGSGIDTIVMDVQYVKDIEFVADPNEEEDLSNSLWSFTFKSSNDVHRKSTWFDDEIGPKFFYRYKVFFKPDAMPGPSPMVETPWRQIKSQNIIANTAELFETEQATIQTVSNFPWERYPQVLVKMRYNDPVSSWLHEDTQLLDAENTAFTTEFRQRAADGIDSEYSIRYIRDDNEVIDSAWEPISGPLSVILNPDPKEMKVRFVVSPATKLGLLILNLRYVDDENDVFEDDTLIFTAENALKPQVWTVPWKDNSKRRFFMQQTIIDENDNVIDTGMVEAEGRTKVLGDTFAKSMEVQTKLLGPDLQSQGVSKIVLHLKYEDEVNGVLKEMLHEFEATGDAPTWKVMLKDASKREYSYELTYVMETGFSKSGGVQTSRDQFLILSSQVPS